MKGFQLVVIGVSNGSDLAVGKATWGTNGTFGGPLAMNASAGFATAMAGSGDCASNGLDFASITGMTWKAYLTPRKISDGGKVGKKLVTTVVLKAKAGASAGNNAVFGVAGMYTDDGDGLVNSSDGFTCWGISTSSIYVS